MVAGLRTQLGIDADLAVPAAVAQMSMLIDGLADCEIPLSDKAVPLPEA